MIKSDTFDLFIFFTLLHDVYVNEEHQNKLYNRTESINNFFRVSFLFFILLIFRYEMFSLSLYIIYKNFLHQFSDFYILLVGVKCVSFLILLK